MSSIKGLVVLGWAHCGPGVALDNSTEFIGTILRYDRVSRFPYHSSTSLSAFPSFPSLPLIAHQSLFLPFTNQRFPGHNNSKAFQILSSLSQRRSHILNKNRPGRKPLQGNSLINPLFFIRRPSFKRSFIFEEPALPLIPLPFNWTTYIRPRILNIPSVCWVKILDILAYLFFFFRRPQRLSLLLTPWENQILKEKKKKEKLKTLKI